MEEIYTIEEVAKYLKLSLSTIYRYIYTGKIGAIKVGGQWRIKRKEVRRLLDSTVRKNTGYMRESFSETVESTE